WLGCCTLRHLGCKPARPAGLEAIRVIDVYERTVQPLPMNDEYLALSYVWGKSEQPKVSEFGSLPGALPLTIEHAMIVVRSLGHRYLWVDSVCIDQSNAVDKHEQILLMGRIYRGAYSTIIALGGATANSGIHGVEQQPKRTPQIEAHFGEHRLVSKHPSLEEELKRSVWMTRAWTYQEGLMSSRCIVFTEHQVHFVCNGMQCSE
ncbi:HET-domain-containing protein, partial [Lindgomyces ingoldianus]